MRKFEPRDRFVVTRNPYHGPAVILGDFRFWEEHLSELDAWCWANGARRQGLTVEMDEQTLSLFVLRWS